MRSYRLFILFLIFQSYSVISFSQEVITDVLIIGGGASGTTAGIQSARLGANTIIIEETGWLGGMLTSAGVSAIDGNHKLPSGLWGEFRSKIYQHYGGPAAVSTGWVSNTLFEPSVGNKILKDMVANETLLQVLYQTKFVSALRNSDSSWSVKIIQKGKQQSVKSKILIDATELGDVMASVGVKYAIGMDSRDESGEIYAPEKANDIIQDLTYVVVLKDYGKGADKTIQKPARYNPAEFACCCDISDPASNDSPNNNCYKMLQYGRLPNDKYMINWPKCGNDFYLNIIEKTPEERAKALVEAKLHTLRFLYYLQTELGYKNLGIADDEFPTKDRLPMIPYHRESRRMKGLVTFSLPHVAAPYEQDKPFYRTGIAVGDYTIDHHHLKNPAAPAIDFVKIRVPSYSVPMGSLLPQGVEGLIVAEKSISVTNIVNGATRLQPVVLQIGQAAGILAGLAIKKNIYPSQLKAREVQQSLLDANGYLMPFIDVMQDDPAYQAIQRVGATGILKGTGVPYLWANQTWFYPDLPVSQLELHQGLQTYYPQLLLYRGASGEMLDGQSLTTLFAEAGFKISVQEIEQFLSSEKIVQLDYGGKKVLSKKAIAVLIDHFLKPFEKEIDIEGNLRSAGN
ncbi:MAG: FAD-dependent oxidoreductase [Flavitalea sp.]